MNRKILIIFSLIILLSVPPAFAQRTGAPGGRNFPVSDSPCWTKAYLEARPEQMQALDELHRVFYKEIWSLRNQYFTEHYELRALLSSPKADAKMVLSKQNNLSTIQKKIDEVSMQYFLKARSVFTPEQLSILPPDCRLGFNYGQGMGWGRGIGPGKGYGKGRSNPIQ
jgi:Spy/CpxP family protein refolding chaperone